MSQMDTAPDVGALMRDVALIEGAVARAQREAIRRHHLLGESVVIWQDGRVVELPPPGATPIPGRVTSGDPDG